MKINELPEKAQKLHLKKCKSGNIKNNMTGSEYNKYINDLMVESGCKEIQAHYHNEPVVVKETERIIERESENTRIKMDELTKQIIAAGETIELLEGEIKKYKQVCIELDDEVSKRDNKIADLKFDCNELSEKVSYKDTQIALVCEELLQVRKDLCEIKNQPAEEYSLKYLDYVLKEKVSLLNKIKIFIINLLKKIKGGK
jgi:FtsZ-binding cell division protein ZapB